MVLPENCTFSLPSLGDGSPRILAGADAKRLPRDELLSTGRCRPRNTPQLGKQAILHGMCLYLFLPYSVHHQALGRPYGRHLLRRVGWFPQVWHAGLVRVNEAKGEGLEGRKVLHPIHTLDTCSSPKAKSASCQASSPSQG